MCCGPIGASSLSSRGCAEIRFDDLEIYFYLTLFSSHNTTTNPQSRNTILSLNTMPQYKSVLDFIYRRVAAEGKAKDGQIQHLLEDFRQKVESNESRALVRPETLEWLIEYCVWAFYCKLSYPYQDPKLTSLRASRCVHRVPWYRPIPAVPVDSRISCLARADSAPTADAIQSATLSRLPLERTSRELLPFCTPSQRRSGTRSFGRPPG
jgi:hypothetical protein